MIRTEKAMKESEKRWVEVEKILDSGVCTPDELGFYLGYATGAHGLNQGINKRTLMPRTKRQRVQAFIKCKTEEEARELIDRSLVAAGEVRTKRPDGSWGDVSAAASLLLDALLEATKGVPSWLVADDVAGWIAVAEQITKKAGS